MMGTWKCTAQQEWLIVSRLIKSLSIFVTFVLHKFQFYILFFKTKEKLFV